MDKVPSHIRQRAAAELRRLDGMKPLANAVAKVLVAWCLCLFVFGLLSYPDAPYRPCDGTSGYCGKSGRPHTKKEFESQQTWERLVLFSWPIGIIAGIYLTRRRSK
jgi:hypothetical protein